jgi:acyl-coenzyme A synthetase/AMP-(fatty) acid ligase
VFSDRVKVMRHSFLNDIISKHGNKVAFVEDDIEHTYSELEEQARNFSRYLKEKAVQKNEVVAILSDYTFESVALFLALFEAGNIIVPVVTEIQTEIKNRIEEAYVDWVISMDGKRPKIKQVKQLVCQKHELIENLQKQGTPGLVLFSSGSTGKPKAMIHDLATIMETYSNRIPKKHRILIFLLFDHIGGLNTLFSALSAGMLIVIPHGKDPNYICELISKYRVNILPTSPTFLNLILISGANEKHNLSSLRLITYGTEPMPVGLLKRLKNAFPKARFLQTFGTSETGIAKTSSKSSTSTFLKIDDPNQEYKIVNGELWLRSKTKILGYLNYPDESFTGDGWFKTGDLVEETVGGYFCIVGRVNEMINVAGQKVLPGEVESVLLEMPQLADCIVYGETNFITVQIVVANIVLADGANPKTIKKDIRTFCRNRMDNYKIPVKIYVVETINYGERFEKIRPS